MPESSGDGVQTLVAKSRGGDRQAFAGLVEKYQDDVYNLVYAHVGGDPEVALDAAQETFVKAYAGLGTFRGEASFKGWLLAIALREAENTRRRRAKELRGAVPIPEHHDASDPHPGPAEVSESEDEAALVRRILRETEPEDARFILLRDLENMSYSEIAAALGVPVGTVKSGLCRARARFKAAFERAAQRPLALLERRDPTREPVR